MNIGKTIMAIQTDFFGDVKREIVPPFLFNSNFTSLHRLLFAIMYIHNKQQPFSLSVSSDSVWEHLPKPMASAPKANESFSSVFLWADTYDYEKLILQHIPYLKSGSLFVIRVRNRTIGRKRIFYQSRVTHFMENNGFIIKDMLTLIFDKVVLNKGRQQCLSLDRNQYFIVSFY